MGVCATHMYMLVTVCKLGMKDCHLSSSNFVLRDQNKSMFIVRNSSCRKVMFSQVSVCPRGEESCTSPMARHHTPLGRHPGQTPHHPPGQIPHPPGRHPLGRHPPGRRPLQRMVRILLECILVSSLVFFSCRIYCVETNLNF